MNRNLMIRKITMLGMLLALQIVAGRFVSISLPTVKIGFAFLPIVITAILFGPVWGGISAVMGDFLIAILGPYGYYPPMAITALLTGVMYGVFLYRKPVNIWRISLCVVLQSVLLSLFMQTYWLSLLMGKGYLALLPTRVMQNVITIPIHIICIHLVAYRVAGLAQKGMSGAPANN